MPGSFPCTPTPLLQRSQLQSGALYAPWGYPFSWGPRAAALAPSRRARRSRTLASHVAAALSYILSGAPLLPGELSGSR
eukprot:1158757-Pelagomonas_calceolata.AAC.9